MEAKHSLPLPRAYTLVSILAYYSTLTIEATFSSETSVDFQQTTQLYILEDRTLHNNNTLFSCLGLFVYLVGPKRRLAFNRLHSYISQKTEHYITTGHWFLAWPILRLCCSETSVDFQQTTQLYIPEDYITTGHWFLAWLILRP
jgi:hypothetical protein